jgi:hypothetical protein
LVDEAPAGLCLLCQARHYHGQEALRAVDTVIDLLKEAGKLPSNYGSDKCPELPRPPSLLGRSETLLRVLEKLQSEKVLIIAGGAGEGKTALAAEAAHQMSIKLLPGGVFMVNLAAATPGGKHRSMDGVMPCLNTQVLMVFAVRCCCLMTSDA